LPRSGDGQNGSEKRRGLEPFLDVSSGERVLGLSSHEGRGEERLRRCLPARNGRVVKRREGILRWKKGGFISSIKRRGGRDPDSSDKSSGKGRGEATLQTLKTPKRERRNEPAGTLPIVAAGRH